MPLGVFGVFLASLLEEIIAPIPSAIVQMASGFIFIHGTFSFELLLEIIWKVVIPASLGVTIGSLFVYFIVYFLGKPFIDRWGKYAAIFWNDIEKAEEKFTAGYKDEATLFVLRTIPLVPSVAITAFCGLIRYNITKYLLLTFLGTAIRSLVLALIGWKVGEVYIEYADTISQFEDTILKIIILIILSFIMYKLYRKKKTNI